MKTKQEGLAKVRQILESPQLTTENKNKALEIVTRLTTEDKNRNSNAKTK